jgi:hypothetical protein
MIPLYAGEVAQYRTATANTTCDDVVGNYGHSNPFLLERTHSYAWAVDGLSGSTQRPRRCTDFPVSATIPTGINPTGTIPSDNLLLSEALARTNPNRVDTNVPVFFAELRELPRMLKDWGDDVLKLYSRAFLKSGALTQVPRHVARKTLEWEFGVKPLISDLVGMLNFQKLWIQDSAT